MDYQTSDLTIKAITLVLTIGNAIVSLVLWFGRGKQATKDAIDRESAVAADARRELERRITRVEADMRSLPGKEEIGDIHEKINRVSDDVANMRGTLQANEALLRTIHQHLMNRP